MLYNKHILVRILVILFLVILSLPGCLPKPKKQIGDFCGKVIDAYTGEPIPEVTMTIGEQKVTTDRKGKFSIASLAPGDYQLTLERDWYYTLTKSINHIGKQTSLAYSLIPLPMEGKILYSGNEEGNWEIYELDLADRAVTRLSNTTSDEINPVKYSDNLILLQSTFLSKNRYNYDLFWLARSSQKLDSLYTSAENDQHPSSIVLGNVIIFQSNGENIYSYDLSSKTVSDTSIAKGQNPVVSPKGTQIAYANTSDQLCVANIDGTNSRIISHPGKINNPCWSQDGKKIAVELWMESGDPRYIYVVNSDGTGEAERVTYGDSDKDKHQHPCWSSDGKLIFFSANIMYSSRFDIYCIRKDDGLTLKEKASWIMVSKDSGDKNYPTWSK
jgi:Tol biopolymer transport system component